MPSFHEAFFTHDRYAVVGQSAIKPFPKLSYNALKKRGSTVYAVDPTASQIEGDPTYPDLASLPGPVDAVMLEPPREATAGWVRQAADAGIRHVWIHMGRETPEALALAAQQGLEVRTGTCAVQYLVRGMPHAVHRFLRKLTGRW